MTSEQPNMTDAPPQLGEISHSSELKVPTVQTNMDGNTYTNGNTTLQDAKDNVYNSKVRSHFVNRDFRSREPS